MKFSAFLDVFLPVAPVLIPLLAAITCILLHGAFFGQRLVSVAGLGLNLGVAITLLVLTYGGMGHDGRPGAILVSQMGNWPAPFGISVAVDTLSALMLCISGVVTLAVYLYVLSQTPPRFSGGYFHPLFQLLLLGVNWAFITGDVFNLFVAFEVMLLASYVLLINGTTVRQMRQAYKYVLLNLIVSAAFVAGCGWLYGALGTLNIAELAMLSLRGEVGPDAALAAAVLLMTFATKAAAFPLWYWLPDTYPTLPPALGGLFAALLTKVGVYAIIRLFIMCFHQEGRIADAIGPLLLFSAAGTMLIGVLGAVSAGSIRRILSNNLVSHLGYMIMGIGLATGSGVADSAAEMAIAATLLYMIQHMIVKCALFLACGLMERYAGTDELAGMGAIISRDRILATLFFIAALSLVGLPPLSGFFGKFLLVRGGFARADAWGWALAVIALVTGALTLLSIARIWSFGFWSKPPAERLSATRPQGYTLPRRAQGLLPLAGLVGVSLWIGLGAGFWLDITTVAAHRVVHPQNYIHAVLGPAALEVESPGTFPRPVDRQTEGAVP